ncbi:MAG: carbohydrate ABC transporter permease [Bifidobacteriaceae bacterium]|jgi:raffinose/stachyose/melibiose transport system permease protein|nr:carbohydrate ABC transporter permease [Bifidobacteriaceae bacterium]
MIEAKSKAFRITASLALSVLALLYLVPVALILMNSLKKKLYLTADQAFNLPDSDSFAGLDNYTGGIAKTDFWSAVGYSVTVTVLSVGVIVLCCGMTAWYIARVKSKFTSLLYYMFVFSMVVPFQMVMFTMASITNRLHLDNPIGIAVMYLGFGAGLSVFVFVGFIRTVPISLEEAAMMDGASAWQVYFRVIFPVIRPTAITVAILNTMWIWNDYLLPQLTIGGRYNTIPVAVQGILSGTYGDRDLGAMMAVLAVAVVPIIAFYLVLQRYIINGVVAGAVKG